jgi:hypothetical protein
MISATTYSVQFVGYVIQDEFTEYHLKVKNSENASWLVRRRYREFRDLHDILKLVYPDAIPSVPGKKLWGNQDPEFVRLRQDQLQVYMNGVLALEPHCASVVLQRFLEIKAPSPALQSRVSSPASPPVAQPQPPVRTRDLNRVVESLKNEIFDLSFTPSLLEAGEYAIRRKRYEEIVRTAKVGAREINHHPTKKVSTVFADPESARKAMCAILGKNPLATEHDLVAFFSMRPSPLTSSPPASSSA